MMKTKLRNKISLCLAMLLVVISCNFNVYAAGEQITGQEKESNNTWDTANVITLGTPIEGTVSSSNDIDYFSYTPDETKKITYIFIDNNNTTYNLYILDKTDNNKIVDYATTSGVYQKEFKFQYNHEYIMKVSSNSGSNLPYQLAVYGERIKESVFIDDQEVEFNGELECANILNNPTAVVMGKFTNSDDHDYFRFTPDKSGTTKLAFHPFTSGNYFIFLYDAIGQNYIYQGNISCDGQSSHIIEYNAMNNGLYYVAIVSTDNSTHDRSYYIRNY